MYNFIATLLWQHKQIISCGGMIESTILNAIQYQLLRISIALANSQRVFIYILYTDEKHTNMLCIQIITNAAIIAVR